MVPATTTVYGSGLEPLAVFPAVVLGQPSWLPGTQVGLPFGLDRYRWPVAVVLEKPGAPDPTTVDVLEGLWTSLLSGLQNLSQTDSTLGGLASEMLLDHADFGTFTVQGEQYPAQRIYLDLYG